MPIRCDSTSDSNQAQQQRWELLLSEYAGEGVLEQQFVSATVPWRCSQEGCDHQWQATIANRKRGRGCAACKSRQTRLNAAAANPIVDPVLIAEYRGKEPIENYSRHSRHKVAWQCNACNHQWQAQVATRARPGYGCPVCSRRRASAINQQRAAEANPIVDPVLFAEYRGEISLSEFGRGSQAVVPWQCSQCDHCWEIAIRKRHEGNNCPQCGNEKRRQWIAQQTQSRATANPIVDATLIAEYRGEIPIEQFSAGSGEVVAWCCSVCDWQWEAPIFARSRGRGCRQCSIGGYSTSRAGWIYFVVNEQSGIGKIGISNVIDRRLQTHRRNGYLTSVCQQEYVDGRVAEYVEQKALAYIREVLCVGPAVDQGDGWTETFALNDITQAAGQQAQAYIPRLLSDFAEEYIATQEEAQSMLAV